MSAKARTHTSPALRLIATAAVAALAMLPRDARAESPWSASASVGLVFPTGQRDGETTAGAWVDLQRLAVPHWALGVEGGAMTLAAPGAFPAVVGAPTGESRSVWNASAVIRGRSAGPVRVHLLGTVGGYDLVTRTRFVNREEVEHDWSPGFSLAIGLSGSGPVMPAFQLRWHEVLRHDHENLDLVSFEVGLHFN